MNAIGIALVWRVTKVTLVGLLASSLYVVVRWWRPAAGAPVVLTGLAMVVVLSLLAVSPWPQWAILSPSPSAGGPTIDAMPGRHGRQFHGHDDPAADGREDPPRRVIRVR